MHLYNIHTHRVEASPQDGYDVKCILNTYPQDFGKQKDNYPDTWFSCGIHPWYADRAGEEFELLRNIVKDEKVLAIGEAGLDKLKGPELSLQIEVFRRQIELAISVDKPLIIHCVKAWDELIALHKEYKNAVPWIIHGYRGNPEQTKQLVKQGFCFSIGESFNKESVKLLPINSVFCETDTDEVSICKVYENISVEMGVILNHFAIFAEGNFNKILLKATNIRKETL